MEVACLTPKGCGCEAGRSHSWALFAVCLPPLMQATDGRDSWCSGVNSPCTQLLTARTMLSQLKSQPLLSQSKLCFCMCQRWYVYMIFKNVNCKFRRNIARPSINSRWSWMSWSSGPCILYISPPALQYKGHAVIMWCRSPHYHGQNLKKKNLFFNKH